MTAPPSLCHYERCHGYIEPDDMPVSVKVDAYNVQMHEWCAQYYRREQAQLAQNEVVQPVTHPA